MNLADARLEAAPAAVREANTTPAAERREVTVLFADLSGFTRMSASQDPEETHAVLNRYFEIADNAVQRYGGSIDKHIGDNVMGVFGAQLAHSNDPERAVRAALDIHQELADLDIGISAHIGLASGTVLASGTGSDAYNEFTVTGETVNLASRLQDIAKSGETMISENVKSAVGGLIETSASSDVEIKGFDIPVRVWTLAGLRDEATSESVVPLIGRKSELAQCTALLRTVTETSPNQIIVLRGEPGIGKSRLLVAIQAEAVDQDFRLHNIGFRDFGGNDADVLRDIAISVAQLGHEPGPDAIEELGTSLDIGSGLIACLFDLLRLPIPAAYAALISAMDATAIRSGRLDCLSRLLLKSGESQRQIISVEDVHWAGETALLDLAAVIRMQALAGTVFVLTTRTDGDPLQRAWRAAVSGIPLFAIDLPPVSAEDAAALAAQMAGSEIENLGFLIQRAEGNPLFLEQLIRSESNPGSGGLPGSIQSVVLTRLDALERHDKDAIQAASVFGAEFSLEALRYILQDPDYSCAALTNAFLLRPDGVGYSFAHALIRDGAYESLPHSRKRDIHLRAAGWCRERHPIFYAEHLDRAGAETAADAYADAAHIQIAALRLDSACALAERGVEIAGSETTCFKLLSLLGEIRRMMGEPLRSIEAFERAKEIAATDTERATANIGIAAGARMTGATDQGLDALDSAEVCTAELDDPALLLAQIGYYRGGLLFARGDREGCIAAQENAYLNAVSANDPVWTARALSGMGDAHYAAGRMADALDNFRRCIELCEQNDIGHIAVGTRFIQGNCRRYLNEFKAAYEDAVQEREFARTVRNARVEMISGIICGEFELDRGEPETALKSLGESLAIADNLGNRRFRAYILSHVARSHHVLGDNAQAVEIAREANAVSRDTAPTFVGPRTAAMLALTLGNNKEARDALAEGEAILKSGCISHNHLWYWRDALEWAIETDNADAARNYADRLESCVGETPLPWAKLLADRGRALADRADGNSDPREIARLANELSDVGMIQVARRLNADAA